MGSPARASFRVGQYLCHTRLGVGGMAEVWLASRQGPGSFEKQLVVKQLLPHLAAERAFSEMFLNEARLAARLSHPNIAQVFELGEDPSGYFMVMEYVDGRSMRDVLRRLRELGRPLPQTVIAYLLGRVSAALHYAHELRDTRGNSVGLVHRDVTPDNILASFDGEVKVVDFGIAKATSVVTSHGTLIGKWPYMSPEQATGTPLDRRADVYALGVVAYELLAGRRPFTATDPVALTRQIIGEDPRPLSELRPDIDATLEGAVHAALRKDSEQRTPDARTFGTVMDQFARAANATADDLATELRQLFDRTSGTRPSVVTGTGTGATSSITAPDVKSTSRLPWLVAVAVIVVVLAAAWGMRDALRTTPAPVVAAPAVIESASPDHDVTVSHPTIDDAPVPQRGKRSKAHGEQAKGPGSIAVRVQPWADVLLDGHAVGTTPLAPFSAPAGRHEITLVNAKLDKTKVVKVEVQPGKTVAVEVNLQR